MILTCPDWSNWSTDTGGSGVVDWDNLEGKPPLPYFEMLRLAAVERCEVSDTTVPELLTDSIVPGVDFQGPARMGALHTLLTSLIPRFVNHTDHGGDWSGQTTCAPAWTEESILADIGDAERVTMVGSAKWARQCREILDRLVWVSFNTEATHFLLTDIKNINADDRYKEITGVYGAPVECADYIINHTNQQVMGYRGFWWSCSEVSPCLSGRYSHGFGYHAIRQRNGESYFRAEIWFDSYNILPHSVFTYDYDVLYLTTAAPWSNGTHTFKTTSFWPDQALQDKYQRKTSGTLAPADDPAYVESLDNHDFQNWLSTATLTADAVFSLDDEVILAKFDVPGGFKFQAAT